MAHLYTTLWWVRSADGAKEMGHSLMSCSPPPSYDVHQTFALLSLTIPFHLIFQTICLYKLRYI